MAPGIPKSVWSWFDLTGDQAQEANEIRLWQVVALTKQTPWIAAGNLVNSALTAWVFWGLVPRGVVAGWSVLIWLTALARLHRWWRNRGRPMPDRVSRRPIVRSTMWAGLAGCMWGSAGVLFFIPDSVAHQVFLAFVIGGMAAGAAATLAVLPAASAAYILISVLPVALAFLLQAGALSLAMSAMPSSARPAEDMRSTGWLAPSPTTTAT